MFGWFIYILVIFLQFAALLVGIKGVLGQEVTVLTYNIRYNNPDDGINAWPVRKDKVFALISGHQPAVFGIQEALQDQVHDLETAFPGYRWVGVGRDDGKDSGEFAPVFYDTTQLLLNQSGFFWLSQTPLVPGSRGWDAACNRIVTWAKFTHKRSSQTFFMLNTHFDHVGTLARRNSARFLLHAIDSLVGSLPVVVTGDFNATPDSEPISILLDQKIPDPLFNARTQCPHPTGPAYTYTGFTVGEIPGEMIDYIFIRNIRHVKSHQINDAHDGTHYPSDHLPVMAIIDF